MECVFFLEWIGAHRDIHGVDRRQRQMCIRDRTQNGAHFFTIGQRKGINIGGYKEPLFVIGTDVRSNILYVGEGQSHPGLYRKGLFIRRDEIHWIRRDLKMKNEESREYLVRIRSVSYTHLTLPTIYSV